MKLYKSFISVLSLFMLAALYSCSQEGFSSDKLSGEGAPLSLHILSGQYTSPDDVQTRVSEEGYTTKFSSGDQIGVLQIITPNNGIKQYNTYCFTLDNKGIWTSEKTLLHQSGNVSYIAYYPYAEIADTEALDAYITGFSPRQSQSTYEDYTHSDLMKGEGVVSGTILTVTLQHLMSLMVLEVCATTSAPLVLTWEDGKIPYQTADNKIFRYLVKPGANSTLKGGYPYFSGTRKFEVNATAEELKSANYFLWKIDEGVTF